MTEKPKPDDGIYFKDFQDTKQSFLTDQRIIWTVKEPGKVSTPHSCLIPWKIAELKMLCPNTEQI